jgi:hypothetical protein
MEKKKHYLPHSNKKRDERKIRENRRRKSIKECSAHAS